MQDHAQQSSKVRRILVVCTANVCRSPLAEAVLQRGLVARGLHDVWVESAGTAGFRGLPASQGMLDFARSIGLDLSAHVSSPLTREKVIDTDLILCMEEHHRVSVLSLDDRAADRTILLTHSLAGPFQDSEIPDPHGGTWADYRTVGEKIIDACRAFMDQLAEQKT